MDEGQRVPENVSCFRATWTCTGEVALEQEHPPSLIDFRGNPGNFQAHSEGHPHTDGAFTGTLVSVGDLRRNSGECQGCSRVHGVVGAMPGRCPSTVPPVFPVLVFQLSKQQNRTRTTFTTVLGTPPSRTRTKKFPLEELWGGCFVTL